MDPETAPGASGGSASAAIAVPSDTAPAVPSETDPDEGSRLRSGARRMQAVKNGVRKGGESVRDAAQYVTDRIIENAPRVPVRDLATLRAQFPGLGPEQLAEKLVSGACAATSTVGAGIGAAAMLPVPPAMPAELAAEITAVAAIELKLIAELHEVYGRRPHGGRGERSLAYLTAWTEERGVDLTKPTTLNAALGGQMKRELRQQIMKRMFRSLPNLMPFMVGAAVGAVMNRRDTRKLAEKVRGDLRRRAVDWEALSALPPLERPVKPLPEATRIALEAADPSAAG
ncbi:hypothetical protein Snoj_06910 [Streptomyces nojiriensis]|uniref:EcsC family protein n=2 Tax=Streptomyces nojiriensis TaxID=66374 RepID=A0ABQ3SF52_9ACTN|nr:hypothetical protein JYK04_06280 [Streptomyces nojiriensis]GGS02574.1 hypothetical protein GCM10010205_34270 [Streptomyces nojiriensis]GHI66773.1 hypothetical protein Snoj_06910 [Streptomyces nojiriensis]